MIKLEKNKIGGQAVLLISGLIVGFLTDDALVLLKNKFSAENIDHRSVYHLNKQSLFDENAKLAFNYIFVGDSLTDDANWNEFFPSILIANRGIQGDTVAGVLNRADSLCATTGQNIVIMLGINDLRRKVSVDQVVSNYRSLIETLSSCGKTVYIQSTLYVGAKNANLNPKISELNLHLSELAKTKDSLHFIDINQHLCPDRELSEKHTLDGIHLNGAGYSIWREVLVQSLNI